MSRLFTHSRLLIVAVCCVALGAGVSAIASAGAATSSSAKSHAGRAGHHRGLARFGGRAVHGDVVVATKKGFATITFDRGTVESVNGRQLTVKEGTKKTNKTVTLTIPTGAKVRDNRQPASLSAVKPGQRVMVITGPKRTRVIARTPRHG